MSISHSVNIIVHIIQNQWFAFFKMAELIVAKFWKGH